ncbi:hypothetical protein [Botrimarina mediterranea]|uniref:hypothetical protein n=1 Tax=Botrimarina mediterranea TaxID=2528022 RepID=UPI0011A1967A
MRSRADGAVEAEVWDSADARRLAKYGSELFTFLWHDGVDPTNSHAEREVWLAVQMRKNSYQNAAKKGLRRKLS